MNSDRASSSNLSASFTAGFRDRDLRSEGLFVTEGRLVSERAAAAGVAFVGIWTDPASERYAAEIAALASSPVPVKSSSVPSVPPESPVPVTILEPSDLDRLAGFPFHRGVLGLARRPVIESAGLDFARGVASTSSADMPRRVLCLPETSDPGNLGTLLRSALAFGFTDILLGERSCDPFNRKALRSAMGATFRLRLLNALPEALSLCACFAVPVYAAALEEGASVVGQSVSGEQPSRRLSAAGKSNGSFVLVLGNEYAGIPPAWRAFCSKALMIPVSRDVDSLNAAIAGSILMWELTSRGLP